jgi:hypothetical protein
VGLLDLSAANETGKESTTKRQMILTTLVESLFPVTTREILRNLTALDFTFVVPPKARARVWKQRDVTRAFKAAKTARIDIAPDSKLSIIPVKGDDPPQANEWDEVLGTTSDKVHPRLSVTGMAFSPPRLQARPPARPARLGRIHRRVSGGACWRERTAD